MSHLQVDLQYIREIMKLPDSIDREITPNQAVAWNMTYFRRVAGLSQQELGDRLGWSKTVVSAAERSWTSTRIRQFTADDMTAVATALGIPFAALLIPPPSARITPMPPFTETDPGSAVTVAYHDRLKAEGMELSAEARETWRQAEAAKDYRRDCRNSLTFLLERLLEGAHAL